MLALLLFAGVALAQEQLRTFRVPFHSVNGMVLLDATVNGKPAVLLLDTGADATIVSPQASGLSTVKLRTLTATKTTGANGEYVKARVDLRLAERHWIGREILVMDLSEASKGMGTLFAVPTLQPNSSAICAQERPCAGRRAILEQSTSYARPAVVNSAALPTASSTSIHCPSRCFAYFGLGREPILQRILQRLPATIR